MERVDGTLDSKVQSGKRGGEGTSELHNRAERILRSQHRASSVRVWVHTHASHSIKPRRLEALFTFLVHIIYEYYHPTHKMAVELHGIDVFACAKA